MEIVANAALDPLGDLPFDWERAPIGTLASITTGKRNTQDRVEDGEFPFFVRSQTVERIDTVGHDGEAVLTAGDGVGTGKVFHYVRGKFDFHQRVYKISDFNDRLNGYYFYLYFSANFHRRIAQMTAKSSVDSVRREMIADMMVPLPPRVEQDAIATAAMNVDALLANLDRLIAKKRDLKQAAMQQLLTGRLRLQGFTGKWDDRNLASLGSLLKGRGVTRDQANSGSIACVRYGEIYTTHHDIVRGINSWISPRVAATATRLKCGDILFAGSGETKEEIGKCVAYIDDFEAYAGGDIVILRPRGVDSRFLGYALNASEVNRQKANFGQGDAVVHISAAALGSVTVRLPPLDEQVAIGTVLADMDTELAALEVRRDKTRQLKQGMMQALLTGRIRLT